MSTDNCVKIDACYNNCMLFYKNDVDKEKCDVCGASLYEEGPSKVPRNVVRHMNIVDQLKGMFKNEESAKLMRYHARSSEDHHVDA